MNDGSVIGASNEGEVRIEVIGTTSCGADGVTVGTGRSDGISPVGSAEFEIEL